MADRLIVRAPKARGEGTESLTKLAINIGVTDYPARGGLDISGLPVYTIKCTSTGNTVQTTDPGRG